MSQAKPGALTAAINFAIFSTIVIVATNVHGWKRLKSKLLGKKTRDKTSKGIQKVVVITGCDHGFGRLLAEKIAEHDGGNTIVVALTLTSEAAEELKARGTGIQALKCDVTSQEEVQAMAGYVENLLAKNPKAVLGTLVNNAGIADPGDFCWFDDLSCFQKVMNVNLYGQLRVTQALLPLLLRTSPTFGGRILNLSSVCGASASPGNSSYNASKFAVEAWSDSLRMELAEFNVSVVKVRPGQFSTTIQSDFAKNLLKNYQRAPPQIRELYGGESYAENVSKAFEAMAASPALSEPGMVVDALYDMVTMDRGELEPYYWLGNDAHTLWRALHSLPTTVSDTIKGSFLHFKPVPEPRPPAGVISHVSIKVSSLEKSIPFYQAFGLELYGDTVDGQQFLRSGTSKSHWPTLVMLQEDPDLPRRGASYDCGMTRLCIYTTNIQAENERLLQAGLKPIAPTACQSVIAFLSVYVTAYEDPDGFVVYVLEMQRAIGWFIKASLWWNKKQPPSLFHWTVNVMDVHKALNTFEKLGFQTMSDQNKDQVAHDLLPAFNLDPDNTEIEFIRMCKLKDDSFLITLMQWLQPKTAKRGNELTNTVTIAVDHVETALEEAEAAGMVVDSVAEQRQLPVFGSVRVGTAYVEGGSNRVEFCCFTQKC